MAEEQKAPDMREIMADPKKAIAFFSSIPAEAWEQIQNKTAINVFEKALLETEAYRDFLNSMDIKSEKIDSMEDFLKLPIMDKDNYVKKYGFDKINSAKAGKNLYSFSLSSGTTDKPTVWPRYYAQEEGYIGIFDMFMNLYWKVDTKKTLAINAFNLGVYASGIAVNVALRPLTQKYSMTLATTGSEIENIIATIKQLSGHYDQTIIFSYPTFVRTILDKLQDEKIDLKALNLKLFIAGEGHGVEWRQYINTLISGDASNVTDIIDGYGTTDLGLLGVGSALTNLIRDLSLQDEHLRKELFGNTEVIPTLFQYVTQNYFIETLGGETCFTSSSATPLVRYNIHDRGGVIKFRDMERALAKYGYDYKKMLSDKDIPSNVIFQQPFVYCFGRRDDTVMVGGGNIFPEQIDPVLFNDKSNDIHSFKLGMLTDENQHQMVQILLELKIGMELAENKKIEMEKTYHEIILNHLLSTNSDYAVSYRSDPKYCDPIIKIFEFGSGPFSEDSGRTKPKLFLK
ncbi:MAG: hypothetical protein WCG48_02565 [Candidatus Berkelbacteria bacterium]